MSQFLDKEYLYSTSREKILFRNEKCIKCEIQRGTHHGVFIADIFIIFEQHPKHENLLFEFGVFNERTRDIPPVGDLPTTTDFMTALQHFGDDW